MKSSGFTLIELLVVIAIIAIATAGATLALRDSAQTQLEREAQRLTALLESARAHSRLTGVAVRWRAQDGGFIFDGLAPTGLPSPGLSGSAVPNSWLNAGTSVPGNDSLLLGPEPLIGRQQIVLVQGNSSLSIATDGLRPFAVLPPVSPP